MPDVLGARKEVISKPAQHMFIVRSPLLYPIDEE